MLTVFNIVRASVLTALATAVSAIPAPEPQAATTPNLSSVAAFQPSLAFSPLPPQASLGPLPPPECEPRTLCVEGANKCGKWEGCWDTCKPWMSPTEPVCAPSSTLVPAVNPTAAPIPTPAICEPGIMCVAGVNECGVTYSGCYDTCTPSLEPTAPPCLTAVETPFVPLITSVDTGSPVVTPAVTPVVTPVVAPPLTPVTAPVPTAAITSPVIDNCSTRTVCVDGIDACGQKYGGCVPDCKPLAITTPSCSLNSLTQMTIVTQPPSITTALANATLLDPIVDNCSSRTVCWDGINECGEMYGGCFPDCTPWPTFTKPPCSLTEARPTTFSTITSPPVVNSTSIVSSATGTNCFSRTVCWEAVNNCGIQYGGCFPDCRPWPTFTRPACPTSTTSPINLCDHVVESLSAHYKLMPLGVVHFALHSKFKLVDVTIYCEHHGPGGSGPCGPCFPGDLRDSPSLTKLAVMSTSAMGTESHYWKWARENLIYYGAQPELSKHLHDNFTPPPPTPLSGGPGGVTKLYVHSLRTLRWLGGKELKR
ncbi:hypothetical protein MCOR15_002350 [Pyricularia oryzae]|nr:hypothetical protein MCOR15_002350 [Pyricularia oryzae]